jgi:hypothetical protein
MPKFSLHAKTEIGLILMLLLGSCGNGNQFNDQERDEIADIAFDAAVDAIADSNIESRISEIESRLNM